MSVFPITFIVSACLLAIFIIYFARTHSGQRKRGVDHEALLPLEEETPRVVGSPKNAPKADAERTADTERKSGTGRSANTEHSSDKARSADTAHTAQADDGAGRNVDGDSD